MELKRERERSSFSRVRPFIVSRIFNDSFYVNQTRSFTALQSAAAVEYRRYVGSAISYLGLIDFIWRFREIEMDFFGFFGLVSIFGFYACGMWISLIVYLEEIKKSMTVYEVVKCL